MSESSSAGDPSSKPTVLVVDDEAGPRDALRVILRPFFTIHTAENAQNALRLLREQRVDLITLDQKLPDRQGLDLLQDIKHAHNDVEVIIITGYGSLKSAMEGIRHGAAGYLLKPFNVTELITLINQTLAKKERLDVLRKVLSSSQDLWGSEEDSTRAWQSLHAQYAKLPPEAPLPTGDPADLLPLLSDLLEAKDRQLLNHCSRVSFYATLLANRLNLTVSEQKSLALGSFLHDIGHVADPEYEFGASDEPGAHEVEMVRAHPDLGARMILPLGFPAEVGQIVAYHHERFDGSGYPHGLQGEGIPLLARIVSIAQAFDHLTADVPGRQGAGIDAAIQRIALMAETHFDPMLTDIFTRVVNECKASLPALAIAAMPSGSSPEA